jgi:hypothetical protein
MAIILGAGAVLTATAGVYFLLATMNRRQQRAAARARLYRAVAQNRIDPTGREYPGGNKWERGF